MAKGLAPGGETLVDRLLAEQWSLTAVERFAQKHEAATQPAQARVYRDLIPLTRPQPGQQYAFEVHLDKCTGCKACVSACHSLNGLEEGETWRDVGSLVGYRRGAAYQQTITTACHHCAEPGCLEGCPVMAYEKDRTTGIVRHLDDQCIGCQYCTMKCPYDVPKYSKNLGIVRKCDMCQGRLAVGEAPACVQACPQEAIVIRLVDAKEISAGAGPGARMLPGAFPSDYTKPSTRYVSQHPIPVDAVSADAAVLRREHAHWPLILMLLLTQLGAGLFLILGLVALTDRALFFEAAVPLAAAGCAAVNAGLLAAFFHLGRPLGAWRFFLGLRSSWMSREILAFGCFAGAAVAVWLAAWVWPGWALPALAVAPLGLVAVFTSGMIYVDTRRTFWRMEYSMGRFFGAVLMAGSAGAAWLGAVMEWDRLLVPSAIGTICSQAAFFAWEMSRHSDALRDSGSRDHLSARLVDEQMFALVRNRALLWIASLTGFGLALAGGSAWAAGLGFVALAAALVIERYVFFCAVVAPRMPGGL